jgi:cofilin
VDKVGPRNSTWDEFINSMPANLPRYGIFDFEFTNADQMNISKLLFIYWLPDNTPIKAKVPYASAKEKFKARLNAALKEFTIGAKNEYSVDDIIKELSK